MSCHNWVTYCGSDFILGGSLGVFCRFFEVFYRFSGGFLEVFWRFSGSFLEVFLGFLKVGCRFSGDYGGLLKIGRRFSED